MSSEKRPNKLETDRGKEFFNSFLQNFLKNNNFKHYSRNSSLGAVLLKDLLVLVGSFSKDTFLKKVMLIGMMYCPY